MCLHEILLLTLTTASGINLFKELWHSPTTKIPSHHPIGSHLVNFTPRLRLIHPGHMVRFKYQLHDMRKNKKQTKEGSYMVVFCHLDQLLQGCPKLISRHGRQHHRIKQCCKLSHFLFVSVHQVLWEFKNNQTMKYGSSFLPSLFIKSFNILRQLSWRYINSY